MKSCLGIYGRIKIPRIYCSECKSWALIIGNRKQCCNKKINVYKTNQVKMMVQGNNQRRRPTQNEINKIIEIQGDRCLYCDLPIGTSYFYKGNLFLTKKHYDHLAPFAYTNQNKLNFVLSCNICNSIKGSKVFKTVEDIYHYVNYTRRKKGYTYHKDMPSMSE